MNAAEDSWDSFVRAMASYFCLRSPEGGADAILTGAGEGMDPSSVEEAGVETAGGLLAEATLAGGMSRNRVSVGAGLGERPGRGEGAVDATVEDVTAAGVEETAAGVWLIMVFGGSAFVVGAPSGKVSAGELATEAVFSMVEVAADAVVPVSVATFVTAALRRGALTPSSDEPA